MQIAKSHTANSAIIGIYRLLLIFFFIFTLYFAHTIVIPFIIAALLTFLLSPLVTLLEKWIGRVFSILLVAIIVFSAIVFAGYVLARQLILFGSNFNFYSENLHAKLQSFKFPQWEIFTRIGHYLENLKSLLFGDGNESLSISPDVKILDFGSSFIAFIGSFFGSFVSTVGFIGIIFLLVIFMLLNREDIRGRIIKLMGQSKISSTSSALEDASDRVSTYLYRQLIVNLGYGFCVSLGLFFIGIPNAILWGCFGTVMRFIPYVGPWIAAIIPIILSFVVTTTWSVPLLTISFFAILELITAYMVEPFYYGGGTGVSSFALILAAIFWTWLWGPIGLLLSTPLTVCLVVIGQYVTNLNFLSVLLSKEQALTPSEECYHRLLSFDSNESIDLVESYLKTNSLASLYDTVIIPIITQTEFDFHHELIDSEKKKMVFQSIREIIEFISLSESKETPSQIEPKKVVLSLPARATRDELGVNLLDHLLILDSFEVIFSPRININEALELVEKRTPTVVCIAVVAPLVLSHTHYICKKLRQHRPTLPIVIGLWGFSDVSTDVIQDLKSAGATKIAFSLAEATEIIEKI
jgi:predicted PurR-regulated permease PerM